MVLDDLSALTAYAALLPGLEDVAAFLQANPLAALPDGRHAITGERVYVIVAADTGRGRRKARLEAHRRYADVQVVIAGEDRIGWRATGRCATIAQAYSAERDIEFFAGRPDVWLPLVPGRFLLLLPRDAHAPLAGSGPVRKAVFKIQMPG